MYPTKSTYDYMTEMNRLFPRTTENDVYHNQNTMTNASFNSPFQQSTIYNRSSSSADSLSPDSFPDISRRSDTERQSFETPFIVRRQRPIIGRKIFDNTDRLPPALEPTKPFEHDVFPNSIWQPEDRLLFPPTPPNILVEQKNYTQNIFYELFPKENKGFEFKTPVSPAATLSPVNNYAVSSPKFSPTSSASPVSAKVGFPRMPTSPYRVNNNQQQQNFGPTSSKYPDNSIKPAKICTFCRKNGETPLVYMNHSVKERIGDQYIVTCPILRSHVCSTCGASGDNAHTITYCPVLCRSNNGVPLRSTTITLKNTRIKSNGRRRF